MSTKYESNVHFSLPEFSDKKIVNWKFNIFESEDLGYDMVIGRDIMTKLGMDLSFNKKKNSLGRNRNSNERFLQIKKVPVK